MGSPPHTWRKQASQARQLLAIGITSTYVEKTLSIGKMMYEEQDHLHIRGENYEFDSSSLSLAGSPPHTWRKLAYFWANSSMLRITSTYVEKTACISLYASHSRDHLHIRGENVIVWHVWKADPGSPPHTWRKPDIPTRWSRDPRITSTYVEKTLRPRNA